MEPEEEGAKKWGPAATRTRGLSQVVLWVNPKRAGRLLECMNKASVWSNIQSYH
jgi:hypothetical protein